MIFGVTNVVKTLTGAKIEEKPYHTFYDLDEIVDGSIDMLHDIFVYAAQDHSKTGNVTEKFRPEQV